VVASEVFEHVDPPVTAALANVRRMLKPSGVLILSTPYGDGDFTHEHFPNLHEYSVVEHEGRHVLENVTRDGRQERFDDLVFHGGPGAVLELRFFARRALTLDLLHAGFDSVTFYGPALSRGVYWEQSDWGAPLAARPA